MQLGILWAREEHVYSPLLEGPCGDCCRPGPRPGIQVLAKFDPRTEQNTGSSRRTPVLMMAAEGFLCASFTQVLHCFAGQVLLEERSFPWSACEGRAAIAASAGHINSIGGHLFDLNGVIWRKYVSLCPANATGPADPAAGVEQDLVRCPHYLPNARVCFGFVE